MMKKIGMGISRFSDMAADKILVLLAVGILAFLSGCGEKDGKTRRISCLDDLNEPKCTIACMTDIQATIESKKRLPKATYQEYTLPADCYAALSSGRAAAVVYDRSALENVVLDYPDFVLLPENIATGHIAVVAAKGSRKLMSRINDYIRRFRADGTYAKMYDRWIRSTSHEMPEIGRPVKPEGRLVIGVDAENPPTSYVQNGQVTGYDVEFSRRLALDLNMTVEFKSIPYDGLVAALAGGKIDLIVAQMDARPEREENVLFSEDYIESAIAVMVLRRDYAGADGTEGAAGGIAAFATGLVASFEKTFIREDRWRMILRGLGVTVVITFFAVLLGTLAAFPLCLACRSKVRSVAWLCKRIVSLVMGTPTLVMLMILYYVIFSKADVNSIVVAIICFALEFAVYASVALSAGVDGVPVGQTEAALALGHSPWMAFVRFVLPQAVRSVLPVYRSTIVTVLKETSVVGYIAIVDLTKVGDIIRSRTYEAFFPLIATAAVYFLTAKLLTGALELIEWRSSPERRRNRLKKEGV